MKLFMNDVKSKEVSICNKWCLPTHILLTLFITVYKEVEAEDGQNNL